MEAYRRWVWNNREFVHSLESFVNGLTWLLPERFSDSEIAPEAVTSILGIISGINQHIIDQSAAKIQFGIQDHGFPWSLCLSAIKELETLVEVVAQCFYGDEKKWNSIAVIEVIKAMIRLIMLRECGYKMLLNGGVSMNVEGLDSSQPSGRNPPVQSDTFRPDGYHGPGYFHDSRYAGQQSLENRALAALSRFGENAVMDYKPTWLNSPQHHATSEHLGSQLSKPTLTSVYAERGLLGGTFVFGEVLHIIRPVIYVLFIRKYGLRSWKPWMLSLSVDIVSMSLLSFTRKLSCKKSSDTLPVTTAEKDELNRRKILWAFYVLRDPFFSKYTRYHLENSEKILNPVPFVGFFAAKLVELIIGAQTRYTYTSAS